MSLLSQVAHVRDSFRTMAVATVALGVATSAAYAQQQPSSAAPGAANQNQVIEMIPAPGPEWTKVCDQQGGDTPNCVTSRDFVIKEGGGRGISIAVYDIKKPQVMKQVRFTLPLGFQLKPGVLFSLDKKESVSGYYDICIPVGCFVSFENSNAVVDSMLKGKDANLMVRDATGQMIEVKFSVSGLGEAFKGKPVDPKKIEEERVKLEESLYKNSDDLRKKLLGGTLMNDNTEAGK